MEIRDPIHGSMDVIPPERAVLESQAFQRLRSIKQLGFSEFSFPGATHNRYLHSLGVCHLAGLAFDSIFKGYVFEKPENRWRFRQVLRLAALLHDIGHGPLSHTTEEVMPSLKELDIPVFRKNPPRYFNGEIREKANHEDYTIKFITDSPLSEILSQQFKDIDPIHIACLISKEMECPDDFFIDNERNFRIILSQIVSSEMDVDRMDYLLRDSYFCGTNYGAIEREWLLQNFTYHQVDEDIHLALNRRALYTFDDFLISRHHMYLMVYFHHKSIVYEEMLLRYLTSDDCRFHLPSDINEYLSFTDSHFYEHLNTEKNKWAQLIALRRPFEMVFEQHVLSKTNRIDEMIEAFEKQGIECIGSNSKVRLSKYHGKDPQDSAYKIFVVDQYDKKAPAVSIESCTRIFQSYEEARVVERLYVAPEKQSSARKLLQELDL